MPVTFDLNSRSRAIVAVALCLSFLSSAFANDNPKKGRVTTNPSAGSYTIEQEIQLGQQAVKEVEKDLPLLPADHPTSKYIAALGQKLAAKAPGYKFPYTFKVVKQKEINAFALPGGPIYVNIGTINAASEAELAGVMGHEISHVVMRHSARQAAKAAKAQVPLAILGGVLGAGVGGWAGSLASMGLSIGAGSVFMKYSRDAETEADMVGAQIIYDAGYDPNALVTFFQKLKAQQGDSGGPSFMASHPDPGNRAKNVSSILSRFPAKQYQAGDSPEFLAAKKALGNIPTETTAQTRETLNRLSAQQLAASPDLTQFNHAAFQVGYPSNWQLSGDERSSLNIYPKGGAAANSIAYGVILSGFKPSRGGDNLDEGMRQLVQSIQQTNLSIDRKPAKAIELQGTSSVLQNGKPLPERVRIVSFKGKGGVLLYALMVAPEPDFETLRPSFDRILNTYRIR
jgi:beta-barrel assembly-enhancing protease